MKRLFSHAAVALILFSSISLAAPVRKTNEDFIQGMWRLTGENGGHAWYLEWTFNRGRFNLRGYPPLAQDGKYRIIKSAGDKLTLELYDQQGNFGTEDGRVEVVLDKKRDTLTIKGQGPFARVK